MRRESESRAASHCAQTRALYGKWGQRGRWPHYHRLRTGVWFEGTYQPGARAGTGPVRRVGLIRGIFPFPPGGSVTGYLNWCFTWF